jgi:hypothetical protein
MNPQELVNDIKEIKATIVDLKKRKEPATEEQLKAINDRPIILDPKSFAGYVKEDLKAVLPDTDAVKKVLDDFAIQLREEVKESIEQINGSVNRIPRKIPVTGGVYGFTTLKAAGVYGAILVATFFGSWLICTHYRDQARETVIYEQAQEVARERNYYYNQIENYKRNNSTYARLFPPYDDKGFWNQFNKP